MNIENRICAKEFYNNCIEDNVYLDQLIWNETEQINGTLLFDQLLYRLNIEGNIKIYFLSAMLLNYPISFKLKHMGFWRTHAIEYGIDSEDSVEQIIDFKNAAMVFGCCHTNLSKGIFEMLINNSCYSLIIISKYQYDLKQLNEMFINMTSSKLDIAFSSIINLYCLKGDRIVTLHDGPGEASLNIFYSISAE